MKLTLRYMNVQDIPQVIAIDRLSFDLPWSERSYAYEINEANYSHMVVLEKDYETERPHGWRRWMPRLNGRHNTRGIVGYGGLWNIMAEAHISTIAVHPDYRGRGWGEILLAGMVQRSITLQAGFVVLEVRVSNTSAQHLYRKYEFQTITVKPKYYRNNNEDAYDMRLDLSRPNIKVRFAERFSSLHTTHPFEDYYSTILPPLKQASDGA
ncbi:MAG: ribosomal protein S18-alanine N-acetyltransferase [Chloroflexota bacterium]